MLIGNTEIMPLRCYNQTLPAHDEPAVGKPSWQIIGHGQYYSQIVGISQHSLRTWNGLACTARPRDISYWTAGAEEYPAQHHLTPAAKCSAGLMMVYHFKCRPKSQIGPGDCELLMLKAATGGSEVAGCNKPAHWMLLDQTKWILIITLLAFSCVVDCVSERTESAEAARERLHPDAGKQS